MERYARLKLDPALTRWSHCRALKQPIKEILRLRGRGPLPKERMQSCGVITLRPRPGTDPRLAENPGARSDDFPLEALQNGFVLSCRQPHARRRDLVRALDRGNLVLDRFARNHLSYQLHCPFHPLSLRHPTTLHALLG
jgi:hypothetical protein